MSAALRHTAAAARAAPIPVPFPEAARLEHVLLVFLCCAAVIPLLYIGRAADTSSFTSWRWVFSAAGALRAELVLFPAMLAAHVAARLSWRAGARPVLVAVLPVVAVLPLWRAPETILDAGRYFLQARSLAEYGAAAFLREWGSGIGAWTDLPLVPFLYGLAFAVAGESRTCIQALNTALFASTALLTWRIGRGLWDDDTGVHAAVLLVAVPFLLAQVPLLLVDVPTMFFVTLAVHASLSLSRRGGALRIAACALALCAAALSKYSAWPMVLLAMVGAVAASTADRRAAARRAAAALALAGAALGALVAARPGAFGEQIRLLGGYQWSGLGRWQEGFVSTFLFQIHPFVTGLAALGAFRAARERDARFLVAGAAALLAIPLGSARARYVIPLLPLLALMAAYGLSALRDRGARGLVASCVAATSIVIAWTAYLPFLSATSMANLMAAGASLDAAPASSVEVYALPQRSSTGSTFAAIPLLDYYTRKRIVSPQDWPLHAEDAPTRTSSLRFSWEMRKPPFYAATPPAQGPVALISGERLTRAPLTPSPLRERETFDRTSGVFRFQTVVTIYARE